MPGSSGREVRYRFGPFLLSPARRQLLGGDAEVRLIPRYFDLLLLLVECRDRAVHRQEIFDRVWADVIVSDGALSQAVRTLRRALGDDPREPRFIRTVSRHGYQFVFADVREEREEAAGLVPPAPAPSMPLAGETARPAAPAAPETTPAALRGQLVDRLLGNAAVSDEERRDAAEQLHGLGTAAALDAIRGQPREAEAIALLRDARWDVPGAGDVPLAGGGHALAAVLALVRLRLRRAARLASRRWASASLGGAGAGGLAGILGGAALVLVPEAQASVEVLVVLSLVGAIAGALGAAGIGAGLAAAEALARSQRVLGLVACGAAGGALAGLVGHGLATAVLGSMFGQEGRAVGGIVEGVVLGAAAGGGYGIATRRLPGGGMATPRGGSRMAAAFLTGACCAVGALVLAVAGLHLVAARLDVLAGGFDGSTVGLAPLARVLGEGELRPVTRTLVSAFEGLLFGTGLVLGLTRRPR